MQRLARSCTRYAGSEERAAAARPLPQARPAAPCLAIAECCTDLRMMARGGIAAVAPYLAIAESRASTIADTSAIDS